MNAITHCVEALYAKDANPIVSLVAEEGIRALAASLPVVVKEPANLEGRTQALYGAWWAEFRWGRREWRRTTSCATRWAGRSTCRTRRHTQLFCRTPPRITRKQRQRQ